jgi:hypothetical protein
MRQAIWISYYVVFDPYWYDKFPNVVNQYVSTTFTHQ